MQATLAPPKGPPVPLGPLPMGAVMPDHDALLYAGLDEELTRPPLEDLDEILELRCASL